MAADTADLSFGRRWEQKRKEALAQLACKLENVASRYGESTVEDALRMYRSADSVGRLVKGIGNRNAKLMARPTAAEALSTLEEGARAIEAAGAFSAAVRDQLDAAIDAVRAELLLAREPVAAVTCH